MSKSKKEPYAESIRSGSLRRTIINEPSSSRRSEDYDGYGSSQSKSSDSSPERKKTKYVKPVARGSETGIIYNKDHLKKLRITFTNKLAKPPLLNITNPETITPVRRPELTVYGEVCRYEAITISRKYNEGKRPIFSKSLKEDSDSTEDRNSSSRDYPLEGSRRKAKSKKRHESPNYRSRKSRRDSSGSRKHRRNHSTPSRHSCSSDSSSSSDERRRKRHYYRMRSEREREERRRKEYEKEVMNREISRRTHQPPSLPPSHSNGGKAPFYPRDRNKQEQNPEANNTSNQTTKPYNPNATSSVNNPHIRPMHPGWVPTHPYMMRPMRPFGPPFVPGYPHPPPRPGFFPVPHMPVPTPRMSRLRLPPIRGFFHP